MEEELSGGVFLRGIARATVPGELCVRSLSTLTDFGVHQIFDKDSESTDLTTHDFLGQYTLSLGSAACFLRASSQIDARIFILSVLVAETWCRRLVRTSLSVFELGTALLSH